MMNAVPRQHLFTPLGCLGASPVNGVAVALAFCALAASLSARAQTVDDVVRMHSGECTTAGVEGLSEQLVRTHLCMFPDLVTTFAPYPGIHLTSSRVHPLSSVETRDALHRAAAGGPLEVTSAFRTLVQQYLLYHEGGCGLAARPGSSNHQSGTAVDLSNWSAALARMRDAGCRHPYPTDDPVHFDCPGPDMRPASVLVFQRLWNVNNPGDRIAEDGVYGPQTASRLGRSPARGFPRDGCAPAPPTRWGAEWVAQSFPLAHEEAIVLRPGEELSGYIELRNIGTEPWDERTRLGTTQPRDRASAFAGPDWLTPNRAAAARRAVAPGETYRFSFTIRAPDAPGEHREFFGVVQEGVAWFSDPGQLGPPDDRLQLRIRVLEPEPIADLDAGIPLPNPEDGGFEPGDADPMPPPRPDASRDSVVGGNCSCRLMGGTTGRAPFVFGLLTLVATASLARRAVRARRTGSPRTGSRRTS